MARKARLVTTYLYPDNHAVCVMEERHVPSGSTVKWVEIFERFIESGYLEMPQEGRVILSGSLANLVRKARTVKVWKDNGSPKTRAAGLTVQTLSVQMKDGEFDVTHIPELTGGDFTYQATARDGTTLDRKFDEDAAEQRWGWEELNVVTVNRVKAPALL